MGAKLSRRHAATILAVAAAFFRAAAPAGAVPSMSDDFQALTNWLSHEVAQGLAFNAGETFDPPREITDRRLAPDISVGGGVVPLNKAVFPVMQTSEVRAANPQNIFPSTVMFPNLALHLRAGLPGRFDFAIRGADMTTPPGYKISSKTTAKGQSNSIGFSLRRHFLGGENPLLTVGAHYNHVYGKFSFNTKFGVDNVPGFSADTNVNGDLSWNINSYGLNAVTSQSFGIWTPFAGFGYNYVTGSVNSRLEALSESPLILPIRGQSSDHPEQNQGRVILGLGASHSWINFFTSGEIKAIGIGAGKSWIVQAGMSLPFVIGTGGGNRYAKADRVKPARDDFEERPQRSRARGSERREMFGGPVNERIEGTPTMIFIQ
jgi:hypothetical protein